MWDTAKPFLENWVNEQIGFKAFISKTKKNFPYWLEQAPHIPELVHSSLTTINKLPTYKQELIEEYKSLQQQHQSFLMKLSTFGLSLLTTLLVCLFANLDNVYWMAISFLAPVIALISAFQLKRK